jgi:hypothetical protein
MFDSIITTQCVMAQALLKLYMIVKTRFTLKITLVTS